MAAGCRFLPLNIYNNLFWFALFPSHGHARVGSGLRALCRVLPQESLSGRWKPGDFEREVRHAARYLSFEIQVVAVYIEVHTYVVRLCKLVVAGREAGGMLGMLGGGSYSCCRVFGDKRKVPARC